ncbi:hypothetical protein [Paenibacillus albus]|uniref:Uncharacterized protein n=1 Tax=Paenibacillus albus TaxID=2495582 RepID=A0A3S9ACD1_9BACL|nr:hypothetical protein [Paenibacillus albus]AZN43374.1 hypothetical protein EJC50_29535 [Paenibacillus albus]
MSKAFTTTLEAVSSNKTKTTIKLSMSNSAARQFSSMFLNSIDKELLVSFDDPQMQMELEPAPNGRPGMVATIDNGGVVETVKNDEDETELFDGNDLSEEELDFGTSDEETDGSDQQSDEEAADEESNESSGESSDDEETASDSSDADSGEVSKGELEEFILDVRPAFTDIPFDFPGILESKRESGASWMDIAKSLNQPSSKLQTSYNKYKQRVKKMIAEQTGGAA